MSRYQLYLRLVDISFWISVVFVLRLFGILAGLLPRHIPMPIGPVIAVLFTANIPLAIFLVLARFMRDEYAERIWQQSARVFVNFLVAVPVAVAIAMQANEARIRGSVDDGWVSANVLRELHAYADPVWHFVAGVGWAVIVFAALAPTTFICIYRIMLWRDAR